MSSLTAGAIGAAIRTLSVALVQSTKAHAVRLEAHRRILEQHGHRLRDLEPLIYEEDPLGSGRSTYDRMSDSIEALRREVAEWGTAHARRLEHLEGNERAMSTGTSNAANGASVALEAIDKLQGRVEQLERDEASLEHGHDRNRDRLDVIEEALGAARHLEVALGGTIVYSAGARKVIEGFHDELIGRVQHLEKSVGLPGALAEGEDPPESSLFRWTEDVSARLREHLRHLERLEDSEGVSVEWAADVDRHIVRAQRLEQEGPAIGLIIAHAIRLAAMARPRRPGETNPDGSTPADVAAALEKAIMDYTQPETVERVTPHETDRELRLLEHDPRCNHRESDGTLSCSCAVGGPSIGGERV